MFHTVRNAEKYGTEAVRWLGDRLPPGWSVRATYLSSRGKKAVLELKGPKGAKARVIVVGQKRVVPKDLPGVVKEAGDAGNSVLVTAPFLSPRAREVLTGLGAGYADSTGNVRLVLGDPPVFIEAQGADRDPNREPRPLKSLKGAAAGRVVRALCDFKPPYGIRELAAASNTALGTASRVVALLDQDALINRDARKRVVEVDWEALLRRWSRDYNLTASNQSLFCIDPRGLSSCIGKLRSFSPRYAVTGSLAAPRIAPARLAAIYVDDARKASQDLGLTPTDTGSNVWLLEPYDDVVFERTCTPGFAVRQDNGLVFAAPSQVAVDLLTGPGRSPQEAEALIERMRADEDGWRRGL